MKKQNGLVMALMATGLSLVVEVLVWGMVLPSYGAEEMCGSCEKQVLVTGGFSHGKVKDARIENALGNEAAFRHEIYGKSFTLTVPNLPAGRYALEFGFAELKQQAAGERLFDILCGAQALATNVDLFALAPGTNRAWRLRSEVEHPGDALRGPLAMQFVAQRGRAKLNTFEVRDSGGTVLVSMKASDLVLGGDPRDAAVPVVSGPEVWKDPAQPVDARVRDLVSRLSLSEKAAQLCNAAPGVPRLGLPAYDYWNECLHGVARSGVATVFPQAIGLAATWNTNLLHEVAEVISTEGRAKHHEYARQHHGDSSRYYGLTFWTPNINIFRDPRWGRGQETYGEDPFLTARLGVAFIQGLQGDDSKYFKAVACAKHFAVHSGPESGRHVFDASVPERDFYETYLPQFEAAVREGRVGSVMGAYNRVYGEPACSSSLLLEDLLRRQWGFQGHVVSDCGAIHDIFANHKRVASREEAVARAIQAGCDLCCGTEYTSVIQTVRQGLLKPAELDRALGRILEARFRLGLFDPADRVAYARIAKSENDTPEHEALALRAARESMVLLKNEDCLPLDRSKIKRLAVIGANADSAEMLAGNYNGDAARPVTILSGIKALAGKGIEVVYDPGCPLAMEKGRSDDATSAVFAGALRAAAGADVVIYVGGLNPRLEGEEMPVNYVGFNGGDRTDIALPAIQQALLESIAKLGKPVVFVNCSGSAVAMPWAAEHVPAILQAWYPGEQGGRAVAEVLFGDCNPAGRLPITFYRNTADLPPFEEYSMVNRTYRYFTGKPLFAFGHGLSLTRFDYVTAKLKQTKLGKGDSAKLMVTLKNTGNLDGDEVVQVYYRHLGSTQPQLRMALCAFTRVSVPKQKSAAVSLEIPAERLRYWDAQRKAYVIEPGSYEFLVGGASDHLPVVVPLQIQ
jgi:beta-glucosidase